MTVYQISMPVTLNVEIEANNVDALELVLRELFNPSESRDPLEGVKVRLPLLMPFTVSDEMTVKTCTLDPLDEITIRPA